MFGLNVLKTNIQGTGSSGGYKTEYVLASDLDPFIVSNVVKNSVTVNFLVAARVKNSAATDFIVFA